MTSCVFWGASPYILDFEFLEPKDNAFIIKLFEQKDRNNYSCCRLCDPEKYIETVITFSSGDKLVVACENIVFGVRRWLCICRNKGYDSSDISIRD